MTERTIQVSMTETMAAAICAYVEDQRNQEHSAEDMAAYDDADAVAMLEVLRPLRLMEKATKLYEDDDIALFEHPIEGDEASVMAYYKDDKSFQEDTGFYDADAASARELVEYHRTVLKGIRKF